MPNLFEGKLNAEGFKFGIVVSRFNDFLTSRLLEGAVDTLIRHNSKDDDIFVAKVPGAFEIPYAAKKMILKKRYDALICLGAVIQGATSHYQYISSEVTKGIAAISLDSGIPVIYGIITAETLEQAIERAGTKSGNKGRDAAISAIEMVNLFKELDK